jgi:DNA-binding transcriptional MerR regulator
VEERIPIGRFARLCGLTVGSLRHYHEVGLLPPVEVDERTGFRRYSASQVERARAIVTLRDLGLPIGDVGAVLDAEPSERGRLLAAYRDRVEARIWRFQRIHYRLQRIIEGEENLMAPKTTVELEPETERKLAASLFNHVWTLLELETRTPEQIDEMIHAAHASRHHWAQVGGPENLGRGEWQCSRIYAVLGRVEPALWHARRYLEICEQHSIEDWDIAFAHEALARAYAVAGDRAAKDRHLALARDAADRIAEDDDRELLVADLATIP